MEDTTMTPSDEVKAEPKSVEEKTALESDSESPEESKSSVEPTTAPPHPYLDAIMKCSDYWEFEKKDPVPFKSLEEMPYTIVDTKELLDEMMAKLSEEKEIGVAVKGSNYRSFRKTNCLIQLATRIEVFIIDTVALKEDIKVLNELFTDGSVLKVAHTKDAYLRDFQKDLGLYTVNMFCLPIAGKAINRLQEKGVKRWNNYTQLEALLKEYCEVDYSKPLKQLQDWHERPLPDQYLKCARLTVQYLLYIHDKIRNRLIEHNLLKDVYEECRKMCSTVWQPVDTPSTLSPTSYKVLYKRLGEGFHGSKEKQLNNGQMEVFRVLFDWRHNTAEKHNEGLSFLLEDLALYDIAKASPKDLEEITNCLAPHNPCTLLKDNLEHLCELIVKAIDTMSGAVDAEKLVPYTTPKPSEAGLIVVKVPRKKLLP